MILEVDNGSFGYRRQQPILQDIRLRTEPGSLLAILGPNGAGKTTLLRCLLGFLRWTRGESRLDGRSIRSIPHRQLWQHIAYVPQAKGFSASCTAKEAVMLGRNAHIGLFSQPARADEEMAEKVLEELGIAHLSGKCCAEISGGELQMVLIARALAAQPRILVLDEPESNLDFRNQLIVLDTMSRLAASGLTCIFNTHYPEHALQRSDHALLLKKGGGSLFGETHRVVTEENIAHFFGVKAVIGEIETEENVLHSILPLGISDGEDIPSAPDERRIAVISVILHDDSQAELVNGYLHQYSRYLIGRMGMPYRKAGLFIIHVTLDAPASEIAALAGKLGLLRNSSVKVTYAKSDLY